MTSIDLAIHLGVPAVIAVVFWIVDLRSDRHAFMAARITYERARLRYLEGRHASVARVSGSVSSPDGKPVTIGTSVEKPEAISGTPTLTTAEWYLGAEGGRRYRVRAGEQMKVSSLPGAERKLVRTVTTGDGVEQTYSFELPDGFAVSLIGAERGGRGDGAFREGVTSLEPFLGTYLLGTELGDPCAAPPEPTPTTSSSFRVIVVAIIVAATLLGFVPYLGPLVWWAIMVLAVLAVLFTGFGGTVAPLDDESRARLTALERADGSAPADELDRSRAG